MIVDRTQALSAFGLDPLTGNRLSPTARQPAPVTAQMGPLTSGVTSQYATNAAAKSTSSADPLEVSGAPTYIVNAIRNAESLAKEAQKDSTYAHQRIAQLWGRVDGLEKTIKSLPASGPGNAGNPAVANAAAQAASEAFSVAQQAAKMAGDAAKTAAKALDSVNELSRQVQGFAEAAGANFSELEAGLKGLSAQLTKAFAQIKVLTPKYRQGKAPFNGLRAVPAQEDAEVIEDGI